MAETGKLVVQVYTGRRAFPVSGAGVSMLGRGEDGYTRTEELEAPDESISLDENSGSKAYRTIDIFVDSPGYYSAFVEGVQVYGGQLSRQEIKLIPLPESLQNAGEGGCVSYYIPPQEL